MGQRTNQTMPKIALVGCGGSARAFFIPVLIRYANFAEMTVLVDPDKESLRSLQLDYQFVHVAENFEEVSASVDGAIVATPHDSHVQIAKAFLENGASVLVEKPLAPTLMEALDVIDTAKRNDCELMVNNFRRLYPSYQHVKEIVDSNAMGALKRITIQDGSAFDWPSTSGFRTRDAQKARGVLLDRGAHSTDVVCWWMGGRPRILEARSDGFGGGEGVFELIVEKEGCIANIRLSRLSKLENRYVVQYEQGVVSGDLLDPNRLEINREGKIESLAVGRSESLPQEKIVENFIDVVSGRGAPLFLGEEVLNAVEVTEEAYNLVQPFRLPWYENLHTVVSG